jgi:hypothetical protein
MTFTEMSLPIIHISAIAPLKFGWCTTYLTFLFFEDSTYASLLTTVGNMTCDSGIFFVLRT